MNLAKRLLVLAGSVALGLAGAAVIIISAARPLQAQTYTTLYSFQGKVCTTSGYTTTCTGNDGEYPYGGLFRDESTGNLFGTTYGGGNPGPGTVFELPSGSSTDEVLLSTGELNVSTYVYAANPYAGLVMDKYGNLYGTTVGGGTYGNGDVYELSPPATAGGAWTWTELHSFGGVTGEGTSPMRRLWLDSLGNLHGTTSAGGRNLSCPVSSGCGTVWTLNVYALDPASTYTILYSFAGGYYDGAQPEAGVIEDNSGNLWGTADQGGSAGGGAIFKLTPPVAPATTWTETIWPFAGGADPEAALVMDSSGVLYGTTRHGGTTYPYTTDPGCYPTGCGTVFKFNPSTDSSPIPIHLFNGQAGTPPDGAQPVAGLTLIGSTLYGTTEYDGANFGGVLFSVGTDGSNYADLHDFGSVPGDGQGPMGLLVADASGNLYGTASRGGTSTNCSTTGCGTVFEFTPAGTPAPIATLSPTSLDFGSVNVGTPSGALSVTVTNTGNANLAFGTVGAWSITGTNAGDFTVTLDTCSGLTIGFTSPNNTCSVSVKFLPSQMGGENSTLDIFDTAAGSPQTVSLTGTGVAPLAALSPSSLSFSSQVVFTTSAAQTVTLTNSGSYPLAITSIAVSPNFILATDTCGSSVAAGSNCAIYMEFAPTISGSLTGTLTVTDDSGNVSTTTTQTASLSGTGTAETVETAIATVIAGVNNLGLPSSQTNGLVNKLTTAEKDACSGDVTDAIQLLQAFVTQLSNNAYTSRVQAQAAAQLIQEANALIVELEAGTFTCS